MPKNKYWRQDGGRQARVSEKVSEGALEMSLKIYRNARKLTATRQYIETKITGSEPPGCAKIIGRAAPDWFINLNGKPVWMEAKSRKAKDKYTMKLDRTNINQWTMMRDELKHNALCFYIFRWEYPSFGEDWRLYPVERLSANLEMGREPSVTFLREDGIPVPSPNGYPEWLEVLPNA